jgi:hypothetical protein
MRTQTQKKKASVSQVYLFCVCVFHLPLLKVVNESTSPALATYFLQSIVIEKQGGGRERKKDSLVNRIPFITHFKVGKGFIKTTII